MSLFFGFVVSRNRNHLIFMHFFKRENNYLLLLTVVYKAVQLGITMGVVLRNHKFVSVMNYKKCAFKELYWGVRL